jgi:hypothetical protein
MAYMLVGCLIGYHGKKSVSINRSRLLRRCWRRGSGSNRRIKVLQTSPLPLGYRALAGLSIGVNLLLSIPAVADPAGAGGRNGAGDEI